MTVIGRLDNQVDEVLIRPLSKRPRPDDDGDSHARGEKVTRTPPPRDSKTTEAEPSDARAPQELPVWLL